MKLITEQHPALRGSQLLLPAVSIGNVGQLAVDLIIETLQATPVGRFTDPALLPCVGAGSYSHVPPTTPVFSMELFSVPSSNLFIIQQRSPAAPGLQLDLAARLADWIQGAGVSRVVLLGSLDGSFRRDDQLRGSQLRVWAPGGATDAELSKGKFCAEAGVPALEEEFFTAGKPLESRAMPPWPLARALTDRKIENCALLAFVLEGDNLPDAVAVATAAAQGVEGLRGAQGGEWRRPPSWQFAFGGGTPAVW